MKKTVSALLWKKAFDSVPRFVMWKVHHRFGCPGHFKYLVQARHDISERVSPTPQKNTARRISNHLRTIKICVLPSMLLTVNLAEMLQKLLENQGIDIRYRYNGGIFIINKLRSKRLTHMQHVL